MAIKNNHKRGKKIVKLSCALHKLLIGIYTYNKSLRACLVNCNGNYIEIGRGCSSHRINRINRKNRTKTARKMT